MFYQLPITKEQILLLTKGKLEMDDDTWVDGAVYYQQKDDLLKYHIDDERKTITICIPIENFYLVYSMDTSKLASIVRTSTCWSDDWTHYDFNEGVVFSSLKAEHTVTTVVLTLLLKMA